MNKKRSRSGAKETFRSSVSFLWSLSVLCICDGPVISSAMEAVKSLCGPEDAALFLYSTAMLGIQAVQARRLPVKSDYERSWSGNGGGTAAAIVQGPAMAMIGSNLESLDLDTLATWTGAEGGRGMIEKTITFNFI